MTQHCKRGALGNNTSYLAEDTTSFLKGYASKRKRKTDLEQFIYRHLGVINTWATNYATPQTDREDLISVGLEALINHFNRHRGEDKLNDRAYIIKVVKLTIAKYASSNKYGLGFALNGYVSSKALIRKDEHILSLEELMERTPTGFGEPVCYLDNTTAFVDAIERSRLEKFMQKLSIESQRALELRYWRGKTLADIGNGSRSQGQYIVKKALAAIREMYDLDKRTNGV